LQCRFFNDRHTRDVATAATFYGAVFSWRVRDKGGGMAMRALSVYGDHLERCTPGTRESYASMGGPANFEDVVASIVPLEENGTPAHWGVTFAVEDADGCAARAVELGGRVLAGPFDAPWVRMAVLQGPARHVVRDQPVCATLERVASTRPALSYLAGCSRAGASNLCTAATTPGRLHRGAAH
jgi:predicted enzyme related to lactoylglutathione lyase